MRAFQPLHATKVLIALCLLAFSFVGFAEASDRGRHHDKRQHHSRNHEQRSDFHNRIYNKDRTRVERRHLRRDWRHHDRRDDRRIVRNHRRHDRNHRRDDFPSNIQGDAYFGGLSAWRDGRNGIYFSRENYGYDTYGYDNDISRNDYRKRGKIIYVNPSRLDRSCSFEAGVCVIRR